MNLFDLPGLPSQEELATTIHEDDLVRVERIISTGQTTDWLSQTEAEFVALLQGNAEIEYGDGSKAQLSAGDTLVIEPFQRHRVTYTSTIPPCIWLCLFWHPIGQSTIA